jgi:Domain of unknown function (DUF4276)
MLAIFGEDQSDFDTLKTMVRTLKNDQGLKVKGKGYGGCGNLLKACARDIKELHRQGYKKFVVCHDADGQPPEEIRQTVLERVINPGGLVLSSDCIVLIPVQEIEAWILADLSSVSNIFKGWKPQGISNPENISKPKKYLEKLSRDHKLRPRYSHAIHNSRIAKYLNYEVIKSKCPSFRPLLQFLGV